MELQDGVFPMEYSGDEPPKESALYRWNQLVLEATAEKIGRRWDNVKNYKRFMEEAGFEDVTERRFYWPMSPWAKGTYYKTVAAYFQADMLQGVEGISLRVFGALGWKKPDIEALLADVRQDMKDTRIKAYMSM
jgi:hypothetical protein